MFNDLTKLYFCTACGDLNGKDEPKDGKCLNCGECFDTQGSIAGEFSSENAKLMLVLNGIEMP